MGSADRAQARPASRVRVGVFPGVSVHPTSIYEAILYTGVFLFLWSMRRRAGVEGRIFYLYLVLLGACRFMVEFLRINPRMLFGLSEAQVIGLVMVVTGLIALRMTGGVFSGWAREAGAPQSRVLTRKWRLGSAGARRLGRDESAGKAASMIAGAALLASVFLIAAPKFGAPVRRVAPCQDTAVGPGQGCSGFDGHGPIAAGKSRAVQVDGFERRFGFDGRSAWQSRVP